MVEELTPEELGLVNSNDPQGTMSLSASMVEEVRMMDITAVDRHQLVEMVAAMSEQERTALVAAAEKRSRSELGARGGGERVSKDPRHEPEMVEGEVFTYPAAPKGRPFVPDPKYATPEALIKAAEERAAADARAGAAGKNKGSKKKRDPAAKRTIRMMQGVTPWDPVMALKHTPVVGLDWGNLIALAPQVKIKVCKGMVAEKLEKGSGAYHDVAAIAATLHRTDAVELKSVANNISRQERGSGNQGFQYGVAIPEPTGFIVNFHTTGIIKKQADGYLRTFTIPRVLLDGGSVLNLMPERVAARIGLPMDSNDDIVIRTATNEIKRITQCARFNIEIAGVLALIKVYIIDLPQAYSLLLGRRWLQQVQAFGDYRNHTYVIFDHLETPHRVIPVPIAAIEEDQETEGPPEVLLNPEKSRDQMDLSDA